MVKVSVNRFFSTRIKTIRNEVKAETQRLREKTLDKFKEILNAAAKVATGEIEHQRIKGRLQHRRKRNPRPTQRTRETNQRSTTTDQSTTKK